MEKSPKFVRVNCCNSIYKLFKREEKFVLPLIFLGGNLKNKKSVGKRRGCFFFLKKKNQWVIQLFVFLFFELWCAPLIPVDIASPSPEPVLPGV
jgi:hypothetical protein